VARWRTLRWCVASSPLGMLYGSRGALGPSWGRAWQHREVPSPVRAYPCLCRRTTGACTGDKGAVRVLCGSTGRGSGAWCHGVRMRRVDVVVRGRGHVRPVSPRPARAPSALECGSSGSRARARAGALGPRAWVVSGAPLTFTADKVKDNDESHEIRAAVRRENTRFPNLVGPVSSCSLSDSKCTLHRTCQFPPP
jgi:hypothetical protein